MSNNNIVPLVIESVNKSILSFSKFITANDAGSNGAHQSGFYLHKNSYPLYFSEAGVRGENKDKNVKIKWQGDFETDSRFIYYGIGSRNEYRLTRFGRGFPFLTDDNVGNLLVISKLSEDYYEAFVLSTDDEIEDFLSAFGITTQETNQLIPKANIVDAESKILELFNGYISSIESGFPSTNDIAEKARDIFIHASNITDEQIKLNPDNELLQWLNTEYQLFKAIENNQYSEVITKPFKDVEEFVQTANSILNRRKSRAGKSLEHHLSKMFKIFDLKFSEQPVTEENKKPDFIFPGEEEYHNFEFDENKLIFLASKTTCKDRWRQILNEADRIKTKHLFTLQQGISTNQLNEMYKHEVKLVVPEKFISAYPAEYREKIYPLNKFISTVKEVQK